MVSFFFSAMRVSIKAVLVQYQATIVLNDLVTLEGVIL